MSRSDMLSIFYDAMMVIARENYYSRDYVWDIFHDVFTKEQFFKMCDDNNLNTFSAVFSHYKKYLKLQRQPA